MNTGRRPPSSAGNMAGAVPGTSSGLRTALRSGAPVAGAVGVGLTTKVEVSDRPVTREGMLVQGMKGGQGPKRQVYDKSFYVGELRSKMQELITEANNLRSETEQLQRATSEAEQMSVKRKNLQAEVAQLQLQFRDYNLAVVKIQEYQGEEALERLEKVIGSVKQSNESKRQENNKIFTVRKDKEEDIREMELKIRRLHEDLDQKLSQNPEKRKIYYAYREEITQLTHDMESKKRELEKMSQIISQFNKEAQSNPANMKYLQKMDEKAELELKKVELEKQYDDEVNADSEEKSSAIMKQVKEDSNIIKTIQQEVANARTRNEQVLTQIEQMRNQIKAYGSPMVKNYKELKEKDRLLQEFMNSFDSNKAADVQALQEQQELIVQILDHISQNLNAQENLPTQEQFGEMQENFKFKAGEKIKSESTFAKLQQDLNLRKQEMEKMDKIDIKMADEIKNLEDKIKQMTEELKIYNNLDNLRTSYEKEKKDLIAKKAILAHLKDSMKQQVHALRRRCDANKKLLQNMETFTTLNELEQKIRFYEQNIYSLKEYIEQKGAETDYSATKADSSTLNEELNKLIISSVTL